MEACGLSWRMNDHERMVFCGLCAEWDRVISRRLALVRNMHKLHPEMPRAELYRNTMTSRSMILPRQGVVDEAVRAFAPDVGRLKKALLDRGYYSAAWDIDAQEKKIPTPGVEPGPLR